MYGSGGWLFRLCYAQGSPCLLSSKQGDDRPTLMAPHVDVASPAGCDQIAWTNEIPNAVSKDLTSVVYHTC